MNKQVKLKGAAMHAPTCYKRCRMMVACTGSYNLQRRLFWWCVHHLDEGFDMRRCLVKEKPQSDFRDLFLFYFFFSPLFSCLLHQKIQSGLWYFYVNFGPYCFDFYLLCSSFSLSFEIFYSLCFFFQFNLFTLNWFKIVLSEFFWLI